MNTSEEKRTDLPIWEIALVSVIVAIFLIAITGTILGSGAVGVDTRELYKFLSVLN